MHAYKKHPKYRAFFGVIAAFRNNGGHCLDKGDICDIFLVKSGVKWRKVEHMFYGEYEHSLDMKGRIIIPAKFRLVMKENYIERFFITRGLDECLFMFPEDEWKTQEAKFRAVSFTKKDSRMFNRLFFSGAVDIVPDKQGRLLIPKYLKDYAGVKRDVMTIGVSSRIEIWAKEKWHDFYNNTKGSYEDVAEKLIDLDTDSGNQKKES